MFVHMGGYWGTEQELATIGGGFAVFGADLGEHRVLHHTLSALAAQKAAVVNQGKRNNVCSAKGLLDNNSPHR